MAYVAVPDPLLASHRPTASACDAESNSSQSSNARTPIWTPPSQPCDADSISSASSLDQEPRPLSYDSKTGIPLGLPELVKELAQNLPSPEHNGIERQQQTLLTESQKLQMLITISAGRARTALSRLHVKRYLYSIKDLLTCYAESIGRIHGILGEISMYSSAGPEQLAKYTAGLEGYSRLVHQALNVHEKGGGVIERAMEDACAEDTVGEAYFEVFKRVRKSLESLGKRESAHEG